MEEQEIIQKMCGAKKRHLTKSEAVKHKESLLRDYGDVTVVYRCPFCHYFHVGRRKDLKKFESRMDTVRQV